MFFLDTLLGGGGGDIPPESKLRNMDILDQAFKALRGPLAGLIGGATSGKTPLSMAGVPAYTGELAAPLTSQEMDLINELFGRAGGTVPQASLDEILSRFTAGATPLQQAGEGDILKTLSGAYLKPESNPFLSATIESAIAPLRNEWQNTILPNLKLGFTKAGQTITGFGSSPFDRAAALAANEYTRKVGDIGTQIASQNYQSERDRMLQALGLGQPETGQRAGVQATNISGRLAQHGQNAAERAQQTQELVTTLQAVALPRLVADLGIERGTAEFRNRLDKLLQLLNMEAGITGANIAQVQPSASVQGIIPGMLNAATMAGTAALMK